MMMTESEICFRFKRNGCKRKHIGILAQLNAVRQVDIKEILNANGLYEFTDSEFRELMDPDHVWSLRIRVEP